MNTETALRINAALCRVWFACEVFEQSPKPEDIALLKTVTLAQCQTATEIVEAVNASAQLVNGVRKLHCHVAEGRLPSLLAMAQLLQ